MKIWFDGGARPNPGDIETAVVAAGRTFRRTAIGRGDNNDAEWLAALQALRIARDMGVREVVLLSDSALVVGQVRGTVRRVAPRFKDRLAQFHALAGEFSRVRIRHVHRGQNLAGIALAKADDGRCGSGAGLPTP